MCAWLGNSEDVARDHYLQSTDEHFAKAAAETLTTGGFFRPFGALQNAMQQVPAAARNDQNDESAPLAIASVCGNLRECADVNVDEAGFEPA